MGKFLQKDNLEAYAYFSFFITTTNAQTINARIAILTGNDKPLKNVLGKMIVKIILAIINATTLVTVFMLFNLFI